MSFWQEVDEEDMELFNKFLPGNKDQPERVSLADKILEKIREHEAAQRGERPEEDDLPRLPPKVVEVYEK